MKYTRRELCSIALATLPAVKIIGQPAWAQQSPAPASSANPPKSTSRFGGLEIGAISYSFRQISYSPEDVLKGMVFLGLGVIELEQSFFEHHLGAPPDPTGGGQPWGVGTVRAGGPFGDRSLNAPPPSEVPARSGGFGARGAGAGLGRDAPGSGGAEEQKIRAELRKWRLSAPMGKAKALRKMYDDAGVDIRLIKFPQLGGMEMTDEEVDYCFELAKTMNARGITCEPPLPQSKRVARFAEKHEMVVGYHAHSSQSVDAFGRPGAWEQAFFYSKHNWANVDLGHFMAGNSYPPTDFIREYHDRITNLHLKDRTINNGPNMPWGKGDTPIDTILQMAKREKYPFPSMIELEYAIPEGSSVMDEMSACVRYCEKALA